MVFDFGSRTSVWKKHKNNSTLNTQNSTLILPPPFFIKNLFKISIKFNINLDKIFNKLEQNLVYFIFGMESASYLRKEVKKGS